jgi:hypothetical protein
VRALGRGKPERLHRVPADEGFGLGYERVAPPPGARRSGRHRAPPSPTECGQPTPKTALKL